MTNKFIGHKLLKDQVFRFVLSAGVGFLVDISAFYLFYHNLFIQRSYNIFSGTIRNSTLSLAISFFLGVVVNFLITRYMVFSESQLSPLKQFTRFSSVAIIGFFANLGVLDLMVQALHIYPPLARVLAALILFFASYFVHKFFSFSLSLRHHAVGADNKTGN